MGIFASTYRGDVIVMSALTSYLWLAWSCVTHETTGQSEEKLMNIN